MENGLSEVIFFLSLTLKHLTGVYVLGVELSRHIICKSLNRFWYPAQRPTPQLVLWRKALVMSAETLLKLYHLKQKAERHPVFFIKPPSPTTHNSYQAVYTNRRFLLTAFWAQMLSCRSFLFKATTTCDDFFYLWRRAHRWYDSSSMVQCFIVRSQKTYSLGYNSRLFYDATDQQSCHWKYSVRLSFDFILSFGNRITHWGTSGCLQAEQNNVKWPTN